MLYWFVHERLAREKMLLTKNCLAYVVYLVELLAVSKEPDMEISKRVENCKRKTDGIRLRGL